jgi:hypothetical protein
MEVEGDVDLGWERAGADLLGPEPGFGSAHWVRFGWVPSGPTQPRPNPQ